MSTPFVHKYNNSRTSAADFDCPWCGRTQSSEGTQIVLMSREAWYVVGCSSPPCGRPVFIRIPLSGHYPWEMVDVREPGTHQAFAGDPEVYPTARPQYRDPGVPEEMAGDFQEALRCQAAGFQYGAALVGRRVLEAAVDDKGGSGKTLAAKVESLPTSVIDGALRDSAHEIRFVGNDAAHADKVEAKEVDDLLSFVRDILHALYVVPFHVAARKAARASK
jgi:Domain of unknown function (DUF4145)